MFSSRYQRGHPPIVILYPPSCHPDSLPSSHLGSPPSCHPDSLPSSHLGSPPSCHPDSLLFCHLGSPHPVISALPILSSRPTGEISLRFVSPLRVNRYNDEIPLCVRDDKGVVRDDLPLQSSRLSPLLSSRLSPSVISTNGRDLSSFRFPPEGQSLQR